MRKTKVSTCENKIMVDINSLQEMLSCGKVTASQIGESAGAVLRFGRRKLYNVEKINEYINSMTKEVNS